MFNPNSIHVNLPLKRYISRQQKQAVDKAVLKTAEISKQFLIEQTSELFFEVWKAFLQELLKLIVKLLFYFTTSYHCFK